MAAGSAAEVNIEVGSTTKAIAAPEPARDAPKAAEDAKPAEGLSPPAEIHEEAANNSGLPPPDEKYEVANLGEEPSWNAAASDSPEPAENVAEPLVGTIKAVVRGEPHSTDDRDEGQPLDLVTDADKEDLPEAWYKESAEEDSPSWNSAGKARIMLRKSMAERAKKRAGRPKKDAEQSHKSRLDE